MRCCVWERRIERLRQDGDTRVTSLLEAQDRLTETMPLVDEFLQDRAPADQIGRRIERLKRQIAFTQADIADLAANRSTPVRPEAVTVVDRHIDRTPTNLTQRLAYGWLAATAVLLVGLLGHRLVRGRGGKSP